MPRKAGRIRRIEDLTGLGPAQELAEMEGNLPVKPLRTELYLTPSREDWKNARPWDPCRCVFANYLYRVLGVTFAAIGLTRLYVILPGEKCVREGEIAGPMRKVIDANDYSQLDEWEPGSFYAKPLKRSRSKEEEAKLRKLRTARDRDRREKGELPPRGKPNGPRKEAQRDLRNFRARIA